MKFKKGNILLHQGFSTKNPVLTLVIPISKIFEIEWKPHCSVLTITYSTKNTKIKKFDLWTESFFAGACTIITKEQYHNYYSIIFNSIFSKPIEIFF